MNETMTLQPILAKPVEALSRFKEINLDPEPVSKNAKLEKFPGFASMARAMVNYYFPLHAENEGAIRRLIREVYSFEVSVERFERKESQSSEEVSPHPKKLIVGMKMLRPQEFQRRRKINPAVGEFSIGEIICKIDEETKEEMFTFAFYPNFGHSGVNTPLTYQEKEFVLIQLDHDYPGIKAAKLEKPELEKPLVMKNLKHMVLVLAISLYSLVFQVSGRKVFQSNR